MTTRLPIASIRTDGGTQPRDHINEDVVRRYVDDMCAGATFPPVVVFHDGSDHWLADGFHRKVAFETLNYDEIPAEVHQGTRRDAILFSVGANATHGYPRSNEDKRRAALALLRDEEWSQWSDREIAKRCCVSDRFVNKLRAEVTPPTANIRSERTYTTKHGTTAKMNTANIGQSKPKTDKAGTPEGDYGYIPDYADKREPRDAEVVTIDPATGEFIDPWAGEKREENTRRKNLSMEIILTLEKLAAMPVPPERAVREFFMPIAHDVSPSLDAAVAWLEVFAKKWSEHEQHLGHRRQAG